MSEQIMERQNETKAPALTDGVSIWDSSATMATAVRMAEYLARASIIPQSYQKSPGDCLVAIDLGRRMGISPITVMQNSQVVRGKFTWTGSFCKSLVNSCGKFENSRYEFCGTPGKMDWGCRMAAESSRTHRTIRGPWVTMQMAKDEEWISKPGSKWKTMPELMMRYRAATFFARTECPEVLNGFYTTEEIVDIGDDDFSVSDASEEVDHPEVRYEDTPTQDAAAQEEAPTDEPQEVSGGLDAL